MGVYSLWIDYTYCFVKIHNINKFKLFNFGKIILRLMSCCNKYLDFGCIGACGVVELPIIAQSSGDYTIIFNFLDTTISQKITATSGSKLKFSTNTLNENYRYTFKIIDTNGDYVVYNGNSCFSLRTKVGQVQGNDVLSCNMMYVVCGYWNENYSD